MDGILQDLLGRDYLVIEEGLNSRTLVSSDERLGKEGRNGYEYLIPCLDTHDPLDVVVLMLGTNELKAVFDKTVEEIGSLVEEYFAKVILGRKSQFLGTFPKLVLVCPPLVNENTEYCKNKYEGASRKSKELNDVYKNISERLGCCFVGNDGLATGIDGVHLDKKSHGRFAEKLKIVIEGATR